MPRGPNPRLDSYSAANQLFNQGATRFSGAMDKYSNRIQSRANSDAVSNLLGVEATGTPNDYRGALGAVDTGYAQADKVLSATNSLLTPYQGQYNSDRSYGLDQQRVGIAQSGLGERIRHNTAMENKPTAASQPSTKTIEDVNPYTGAKTYYQYNSKDANPTFTPVDMGGVGPQSSNTVVDANAQPKVASTTTEQPGAYEANYIAQAEANPVDVARAGAMTAGLGNAGGVNTLPQAVTPGVTFGKPDRYGVSQGSNGTFRTQDGNYVIPLKMRELKEIQAADGSSSFVVVNKATGNDASGNPVGDAVPNPEQSIVELPTTGGKTQRYTQSKASDGTITMTPLKVDDKPVVKEATLNQGDKNFVDTYGGDIDAAKRINASYGDTGIWGGVDAITGKVGAFLGTEEGGRQSLIDSDLANMKIAAQEAIKGVPSDKDTKTLELSIPSISDQPEIAKAKMQQFQQKLGRINARKVQRLGQSNPSVANEMYRRMHSGDIPVPYGYDLDLTDGVYTLVKEK